MPQSDQQIISIMFKQDKSIEFYCGFLAAFAAAFQLFYDTVPKDGAITSETVKKIIGRSISFLSKHIVDSIE